MTSTPIPPDTTTSSHRPWARPEGPWKWRQTWHDLLFAHWPVPQAALRPLVPSSLSIDEHSGSAWVGAVPFHMSQITHRGVPPLPFASAFAELNLRTYVTDGYKPGVWFFSLDAANRLAVWAARAWYHLPYHFARMSVTTAGDDIVYHSTRVDSGLQFAAQYGPRGPVDPAPPGSLDHWLTERYCLYSADRHGRVYRGEIDHVRWPLQPAEADITCNELGNTFGLDLEGSPLLHFSKRIEALIWPLVPLEK